MAASKVDVQVLSVCPQTFVYDQPPAVAAGVRPHPERAARQAGEDPSRPLPRHRARCRCRRPSSPPTSCATPMRTLGLRGAQIGSNIAGKNLDDPELEPVWATASELGAFILVHPINVAGMDRLGSYYLNNLIGNPLDTTIAAACLVFSGVLERYPTLKILPVAWRRLRAVSGRAASCTAGTCATSRRRSSPKPPTESLKRFYFDTIMHSGEVLEFLVGNCRRRPRPARQRLSIRHGHDGLRAAGEEASRSRRPTRPAILGGAGPHAAGRGRQSVGRAPSARSDDRSRTNKKPEDVHGPARSGPHARRQARRRRRVRVRSRQGQPHPGRPRLFDRQRRLRRGRPHDRRR